ncbi:MAG: hypothetical protein K0S71_670 [Clostridia bacterium]|jgi:predicted metal-dependent phosphoesterase TrpH|nr:hypothetical protein [Clostridia bacterium]
MKLIDLHIHSNISDGTLSPSDLAVYAKSKGLSAIALTDHDTISGIEECTQKGIAINLIVVPGIEFAAEYAEREIHILGYYIDSRNPVLKDKLKFIIESRMARNQKMIERLNNLGLSITIEDLGLEGPSEAVFTRAHFAAALYKKGYVKTRSEAFDKYIGSGKPAYVKRFRFTAEECIDTIHKAGGLAVIAHPYLYNLTQEETDLMLKDLTSVGLDGIETFYSTHSKEDVSNLLDLCQKYHLLPTGGSDFHGDNKPGLDIGRGYGELQISYDVLEAMQKKMGI